MKDNTFLLITTKSSNISNKCITYCGFSYLEGLQKDLIHGKTTILREQL